MIFASITRSIETDFGDILIHDIEIESYEGFEYSARLYRPVEAQALNKRPGILLIGGFQEDKVSLSSAALELARRGFVALTMEDFGHGNTPIKGTEYTENAIDAGYTFLHTRTFINEDRLGLFAHSFSVLSALDSSHLSDFSSVVFVAAPEEKVRLFIAKETNTPAENKKTNKINHLLMIQPAVEVFSSFRTPAETENTNSNYSTEYLTAGHTDIIERPSMIAKMSEHFHSTLQISNDVPLWFDAARQNALLRTISLFLCFFCLLLSLVPLGKSLQKIPAMGFERFSGNTVHSIPTKYLILNIILLGYFFIQAFLSYFSEILNVSGEIQCNAMQPLAFWIRWAAIISGLILFLVRYSNITLDSTLITKSFSHVLRSLLLTSALFFYLYGMIKMLGSIVLLLKPGIFFLYLKPLNLGESTLFLSCLIPAIILFWCQAQLFIPEPDTKHSFTRAFFPAGASLILIVILVYLPLILTGKSGLEWIISWLPPANEAELTSFTTFLSDIGCGIIGRLAIYCLAAWSIFSALQLFLFRCFQSRLPGSILNGALFSWMIASAATISYF